MIVYFNFYSLMKLYLNHMKIIICAAILSFILGFDLMMFIPDNYQVTSIVSDVPISTANLVKYYLLEEDGWMDRISKKINNYDKNTGDSLKRNIKVSYNNYSNSIILTVVGTNKEQSKTLSKEILNEIEKQMNLIGRGDIESISIRSIPRFRISVMIGIFGMILSMLFVTNKRRVEIVNEKSKLLSLMRQSLVPIKRNRCLYHPLKRTIDLVFGFFGLIVFFGIYIFLIIPYFFGENKGPILFKQKRVGIYGECFDIYKFRSMKVDADKILKGNKALWEKYVANGYKLEPHEDPRITKLGRFLRKTSLDEFPQFINVIIGEMSLVGPRPIIPEEMEEYKRKKDYFLLMKPGITGVWGISGRSNCCYPERCDVELQYLTKRSIGYDFYVLIKTGLKVLRKEGAY